VVIDDRPRHLLASATMQPPAGLSSLLHALAAFLAEHRGGELDGGADDEGGLWLVCACGASIWRTLGAAGGPALNTARGV